MHCTRRQPDIGALRAIVSGSLAMVTMMLVSPMARADEGWARPAGAAVPVMAGATASFEPGFVPPFRAASRDRWSAGLEAGFTLDRVRLSGSWGWLWDVRETGVRVSGPGDVRLGTVVTVLRPGPWSVDLGWAVKLPDATDESELGTDETDVTVGGGVGFDQGPWSARLAGGLAIWGNPLRFANQDDVAVLRASGRWSADWLALGPELEAELASDRNPARVVLGAAGRAGRAWGVDLEVLAGLTPAAPDARITLSVGYAHVQRPDVQRPDVQPH